MEMKNEREKAVLKQIEHSFHLQHDPLVLVEEQMNESGEKAYCSGCEEVISGPCFSCVQCNYQLHKECAEAPYSIPPHPLHPKHSGFVLRRRPHSDSNLVSGCALCKEKRNMFFYQCNDCYFSLDINCAKLSSSHKFNQVSKLDIHKHPLTFSETPMDELKIFYCSLCIEPLVNDHVYLCLRCPLFFHKKCLDHGSNKAKHPSHPIHPLFLESNQNNLFCTPCQKEHDGVFYHCSLCPFKISIACVLPRSIVEAKSRHQHPFTILWRPGPFTCDACDTEGNIVSYICSTCSVIVHKGCTSLPRIIKHSRHDHCIFHKYSLQIQELTRKDCRICFNEVKIERGSYSCVKQGCSYVVHVKCALKDEYLYDVIEDEKQCEKLYENLAKSLQSSITRVVEVNEDGEATMIEHFSHQHYLMLAERITNRKCDGCMLSISSTRFYDCPECPFVLHKTCAELPRNKPHWFLPWDVSLVISGYNMRCNFCRRVCSGFFYNIRGYCHICLRCAKVHDVIECQGHQHFLFFEYRYREQCNACGVSGWCNKGAFRCGKCAFTLDFACLTLPHSTHHKSDEHELKLTYEDGDKEQCICDICEKERDPSLWYYHCSICDNSAHTKCVLGEFPFVQDGSTMPPRQHRHYGHDLEFFSKAEGYPKCSVCGRLCLEDILKCAECNYIIHCKCRDGQGF